MTAEHDNGAPYLLGALDDSEREAFEVHLEECADCREEVERLRPAAEALPRSVMPLAPPPSLKASLMEAVEGRPPRRSLAERLRGLLPDLGGTRPAVAWVSAAFLLALGIAGGFGVANLANDDNSTRTVQAKVDAGRAPEASASLRVYGNGENGALLRTHGLPPLRGGRVYQAWVQRGREIVPQSTFDVGRDGGAATAVVEDLRGADAVMVTSEPRGGSMAPSEQPVLRVTL
ncbi:MAG TPA: anti-sigma factor [Thermoleophilaceae bacterium]|jgi:anti-sigma-K factor RskA